VTVTAASRADHPAAGPCLITGRLAGLIITVAFVATVLLFLFGLITLVP
jgi:hypothetical protein